MISPCGHDRCVHKGHHSCLLTLRPDGSGMTLTHHPRRTYFWCPSSDRRHTAAPYTSPRSDEHALGPYPVGRREIPEPDGSHCPTPVPIACLPLGVGVLITARHHSSKIISDQTCAGSKA